MAIAAGIGFVLLGLVGAMTFLLLRYRVELERLGKEIVALRMENHASERPTSSETFRSEIALGDEEISAIARALAQGRVVLFGGIGASMDPASPTNRALVQELTVALSKSQPRVRWADARDRLDPVELAEAVAARIPTEILVGTIMRVLNRGTEYPQTVPRWLRELGDLRFSAVVTMAWDDLIERAFKQRLERFNVPYPRDPSKPHKIPLIRVFGDPGDARSIVGALKASRQGELQAPAVRRFLSSLMATDGALFIGLSARAIDETLSVLNVAPNHERRPFIALCSNRDAPQDITALRIKHGVIVATYATERTIEDFVQTLRSRIPRAPRFQEPRARPDGIDEVSLENIGPFKNLTVPFKRDWTMLLGDNGSGKTTILRAIAVALSGDETDEAAARRLLHVDRDIGRISVTIDGVAYTTELIRDRGTIRISSDKVTPLQSGALLAVGFPSLRGVSEGSLVGPTEGTGVAGGDPEDLAPLRRGGVDTRLDDVRQWLVNMAVRTRSGGGPARLAEAQLDATFSLMHHLLPDRNVTYGGIDTERWEVIVTIDGERTPIDLLSQGVLSTLTWAGTLIDRLFASFPDEGAEGVRPTQERALLLIDEIDLHLHPEWQRMVVSAVRKTLPNLQVVATTHSPLVVGALEPREVIQLTRSAMGDVTLSFLGSFHGWRSDQILTSDAFGLDTTRDEATERLIQEYETLLGISNPTADEVARRNKLADLIEALLPRYQETPGARRAAQLVDEMLDAKIKSLPAETRAQIAREAADYLREVDAAD